MSRSLFPDLWITKMIHHREDKNAAYNLEGLPFWIWEVIWYGFTTWKCSLWMSYIAVNWQQKLETNFIRILELFDGQFSNIISDPRFFFFFDNSTAAVSTFQDFPRVSDMYPPGWEAQLEKGMCLDSNLRFGVGSILYQTRMLILRNLQSYYPQDFSNP